MRDLGDFAERDRRIAELMPLASEVALSVTMPPHLRDDARSDALVGIVKAVDRWTPGHGMSLRGFARQRATGEVIDGLRRNGWLSRGDYQKAKPRLEAGEELASHQQPPIPLGFLTGTFDGDSPDIQIDLADPNAQVAFDEVENDLQRSWLADMIAGGGVLSPRERQVVTLRLQNWTLAEIACELHVTESRISQIEHKAVRRLRQAHEMAAS